MWSSSIDAIQMESPWERSHQERSMVPSMLLQWVLRENKKKLKLCTSQAKYLADHSPESVLPTNLSRLGRWSFSSFPCSSTPRCHPQIFASAGTIHIHVHIYRERDWHTYMDVQWLWYTVKTTTTDIANVCVWHDFNFFLLESLTTKLKQYWRGWDVIILPLNWSCIERIYLFL